MLKKLLGHNIANAVGRTAAAWVILVVRQVVAVVEGDLFTRRRVDIRAPLEQFVGEYGFDVFKL